MGENCTVNRRSETMGLFSYTIAGGAIFLIGAWESLVSASQSLTETPPQVSNKPRTTPAPSTVTFLAISALSLLFILNSFVSISHALSAKDKTGVVLQLEVITIAFVFLLSSLLGILSNTWSAFRFPVKLLNLMYVFAFGEEFMLFYMQRKDPSGIENRYYDLALVPIGICLFCTILELKNPKSSYPRLGRGIGFVLQGMWTLQMGFSFFSNFIANGCALHEKSMGNFTIKCKGHPEFHRGRAIATLQFNCHLAMLVALVAGVYSVLCRMYGIRRESLNYKPLGRVGQTRFDSLSQFSLDSDDEDEGGIKEAGSVEMQKGSVAVPYSGANGSVSQP